MDTSLMQKVFRIQEINPFQALASGHTAWLLAKVGNLSAIIYSSQQLIALPSPIQAEEEFVYVLQGQLSYEDERFAEAGEAVYNLPDVARQGSYRGMLLVARVLPEVGTSLPERYLMKKVIHRDDVEPLGDVSSANVRRVLLLTDNISVSMNESEPGSAFDDPGHPEKEIIFVIRGQLEYDDGRVVKAGEAIVNLPNLPHPGRRAGTEHIRTLEFKSPRSSRLVEMLGNS